MDRAHPSFCTVVLLISLVSGRKLVFSEAAWDVAANASIRREFGLPPARSSGRERNTANN